MTSQFYMGILAGIIGTIAAWFILKESGDKAKIAVGIIVFILLVKIVIHAFDMPFGYMSRSGHSNK